MITPARDLPDDDVRAARTTAVCACLLDRDCTRLPKILRSVRESAHDPMAPHRRALKEYVLGPDRPTAVERFNAAVSALAGKAAAQTAEARGERRPDLVVPSQRTGSGTGAAEPGGTGLASGDPAG
ncbi:hypothetical protein AB0M97_23595 [Streptomyces sp. NPDC051207]|uniref:hypothetical protein n=1 Tax=Streptomyces sp. NPDC051207 TaxID=3154641 RepID=UPI0034228A70